MTQQDVFKLTGAALKGHARKRTNSLTNDDLAKMVSYVRRKGTNTNGHHSNARRYVLAMRAAVLTRAEAEGL